MSKLSDFFPSPSPSVGNAYLVLVGGGAGNGTVCYGGGGGGQLYGKIQINPGTTYPVTIGAGGAAGCNAAGCVGYPGGKGSPGGKTTFGSYGVLGGGAAGTICFGPCGSQYPFCCTACPCILYLAPADNGGSGGMMRFCGSQPAMGYSADLSGVSMYANKGSYIVGTLSKMPIDNVFVGNCNRNLFGKSIIASTPSPTCTIYASTFFGLCVGSQPYGCTTSSCQFLVECNAVGCSRYNNDRCPCTAIGPNANTGHAACASCTAGDSGVAVIVYPCPLGAASATPGAVDCTPVTGPLGFRSYKFTSSGSFTL